MQQPARIKLPLTRRKKVYFAIALAGLVIAVLTLIYISTIIWRCSEYLRRHARWVGSVYQSDPDFGYVPHPNASAFHVLREGERIPVHFDADGFRVPPPGKSQPVKSDASILFLGCSFTHGYGVPAEQTFAQLAANELSAKCLNGGVSGWGLSQMLLRARRDIPRFRPQYVVVQYSNWLPSRSQQYYSPSDFGTVPSPYFHELSGQTKVHRPIFRPIIQDLLRAHPESRTLLPFSWNVGLPLFLHDDRLVAWTTLTRQFGLIPQPLANRQEILRYTLDEIRQLCVDHGGRMVIVKLRNRFDDTPLDKLDSTVDTIIDTFEPLASALPERTPEAWGKNYYHWRGNPPRLVDMHPSPQAHAIISRAIAHVIREMPAGKH